MPGQPHAGSAWQTGGGDGAQPRLRNVNVHNDFRARGEADGGVRAAERESQLESQRQEQEDDLSPTIHPSPSPKP